jgi:hypothetical protein
MSRVPEKRGEWVTINDVRERGQAREDAIACDPDQGGGNAEAPPISKVATKIEFRG